MSDAPPTTLPARTVIAALVAIALVPALHAVLLLGRIHPDEVYQVLEPAYHRAHGYGILAWEWTQGIRNWAVPLLFAGLLKLCAWLGIDHPRAYRAVLEVPQLLLHLAMLWAVYRYALRRVGSGSWALFATAALGLHGLVVIFAGRTMSESFSAAFLVLAVEALDRAYAAGSPLAPKALRNAGLLGGLYLGLAVVARYGSAVVVVAALAYLLVTRRFRLLAFTAAAGVAVALLLGALDWATWGKPFHSLGAYLDFNVFSGQAARQFGAAPWTFYVPWFFRELPLWAWIGLPALLWKERPRVPIALVAGAAYLVAIVATPHKEERFLYPGLVLLALACAPGLVRVVRGLPVFQLRAIAAATALLATTAPLLYSDWPELRADQLRAIVWATRGDATGLLIVNEGVWGAGGFFYLGKNIPWGVCDYGHEPRFIAAVNDRRINRAVTFEDRAIPELQAAGFREIHRIGREAIFAR